MWVQDALSWLRGLALPWGLQGQSQVLELLVWIRFPPLLGFLFVESQVLRAGLI